MIISSNLLIKNVYGIIMKLLYSKFLTKWLQSSDDQLRYNNTNLFLSLTTVLKLKLATI